MIESSLYHRSSVVRICEESSCSVAIYENSRGFLSGVHIHFGGELAHFLEHSTTSKIIYKSVIDIEGRVRQIPEIAPGDSDEIRFEAASRAYKHALLVYGEHPPSFHDAEILIILRVGKKSTSVVSASYSFNLAKFITTIGISQTESRCEVWSQRKQDYLTYEKCMDLTSIYIQPKAPINRLIEEQAEKLILYSTEPYELIG